MASWTPEDSKVLSILLDEVVGNQELAEIRQDYCTLKDSLELTFKQHNRYFTGSKSEGLDLPGSDEDYMKEVNDIIHIKVTQSLDDIGTSPYNIFLMSTDNVPPGFALLQHLHPDLDPVYRIINEVLVYQNNTGIQYLSSDLVMQHNILNNSDFPQYQAVKRQGPSMEVWTHFCDTSESGTDSVFSIHCAFWPQEASEWVQRPRHFGWPTLQDISSITDFGFHLVPIGHPYSESKLMEWRLSFSLAERTLVWSFNHIQIQCYAVMKIILKEFIKVQCNPQNQVLCSYFIKTFLFLEI